MENITQSFIKELYDYLQGDSCGLQIKAKYYDGIEFPASEVQLLGQYFEYKATGQKTKFGHIPKPIRLKPRTLTKKEISEGKKQKDVVGPLSKKFAVIEKHLPFFHKMIKENGFKILRTGVTLAHGGMQGDLDIEALHKPSGKKAIIDVKTSGLLNNKYEDFGWHPDSLEYKDRLMIQPVHYKILGKHEYGYYPDFFFFLFSNTNDIDRRIIKVEIDEDRAAEHLRTVARVREIKNEQEKKGWQAKPKVALCAKCPLKESCKDAIDTPQIEIVYY